MSERKSSGTLRPRPGHPHTPAFEWAAALVASLLVAGLLGYLGWEALAGEESLPHIAVRADSVVITPSGYLVMFTARNEGGQTAAEVEVQGALKLGAATVEASGASIDYLPEGGERQAGLIFTRDPRRHTLELRATGFDTP